MSVNTLKEAFVLEFAFMKDAEEQLTEALSKMAEGANDPELAEAFEEHLNETKEQIRILEQVAEVCDIQFQQNTCEAMKVLIKIGDKTLKEIDEGPIRDAMLIAAAQKVEHYEVATYGTLVALADKLGYSEAVELLEQILDQEKSADEKLTGIAERNINDEAMKHAA